MKTFIFGIIISTLAVAGPRWCSTQPPQTGPGNLYASIVMPGQLEPDRGLIVDPSGALSSRQKQLESLGIVTISGVVPSHLCKQQIGDAVQRQSGVREVKNQLVVLDAAKTNR